MNMYHYILHRNEVIFWVVTALVLLLFYLLKEPMQFIDCTAIFFSTSIISPFHKMLINSTMSSQVTDFGRTFANLEGNAVKSHLLFRFCKNTVLMLCPRLYLRTLSCLMTIVLGCSDTTL